MAESEFANFDLRVTDTDFQDILDGFDSDFDDFIASGGIGASTMCSTPEYQTFLRELGMVEDPGIPPAESPPSKSEPMETSSASNSSKRFKSMSIDNLKKFEEMSQSDATKRNTRWGVKILQDWHNEKFGSDMDMQNITVEELGNKMGQFYCEVRPQTQEGSKGSVEKAVKAPTEYHKNTLKNIRCAINRHLSDLGRQIDIVHDPAFKTANKILNGYLKQNMAMGKSKPTQHKEVISKPDLEKISAYLDGASDNPITLRLAIWYFLSIHFVSRGLEFHYRLHRDSFVFNTDENDNEYVSLTHETQQKNYQGGLNSKEEFSDKRMYATGGESCPVKLLKSFFNKTDESCTMLFNQCNKEALAYPKSTDIWYINKPLGKYTFRNFLPDICKQAGCSTRYTAHSLRATAIQAMSDHGFQTREIMYWSGHRSEASVRSYNRDYTTSQKQSMSAVLAATASGGRQLQNDFPRKQTTAENTNAPTAIEISNSLSSVKSGLFNNSNFTNCCLNFNMKM